MGEALKEFRQKLDRRKAWLSSTEGRRRYALMLQNETLKLEETLLLFGVRWKSSPPDPEYLLDRILEIADESERAVALWIWILLAPRLRFLQALKSGVPAEKVHEDLAGPWIETAAVRIAGLKTDLKVWLSQLLAGTALKKFKLKPSHRRELGHDSRRELAERLMGAVIAALNELPPGDHRFARFLTRVRKLAVPRASKKETVEALGATAQDDFVLELEAADEVEHVKRHLAALAPSERACQELQLQGLSPAEIAARVGKSPGQVRVHLYRARKKLRQLLAR